MTRPLPNCALCGETLRHKGRSVIKWAGRTGQPMIGWCENCDWGGKDPEFLRLKPQGDAGHSDPDVMDSVFEAIDARGPGRVTWASCSSSPPVESVATENCLTNCLTYR